MRKIHGEIKASVLPVGGLRIEIEAFTGERFLIDLDPDRAKAFRDQIADSLPKPRKSVADPTVKSAISGQS